MDDLFALAQRYMLRYSRSFCPRIIREARGAILVDRDGREILDFTSGQICSTIGHNHPRIVEAIEAACRRVIHLNSWMLTEEVIRLCHRLAALLPAPLEKVLLLNTGSESNEVAFRIARMHTGRSELVGLNQSFHGLTAGAASVTFAMGHAGYGPGLPGTYALPAPYAYRCPVKRECPTCDLACLEAGLALLDAQSAGALAAVIAEPILSSGGIIEPPPGYLQRLQAECRARGMLLILDEAQTGFGRLGAMFGFEQEGVVPDILTLSKTLGGGVPLAATVTSPEIEADIFAKGFFHITSHVSDPLPAAVGLAVLDVIQEESLVALAAKRGAYLKQRLHDLAREHELIGEVRGRGLLLGVELVKDRHTKEAAGAWGARITEECLERGLSMNIVRAGGAANVFRIAPPLTVTEEEIDRGVAILDEAIRAVVYR